MRHLLLTGGLGLDSLALFYYSGVDEIAKSVVAIGWGLKSSSCDLPRWRGARLVISVS